MSLYFALTLRKEASVDAAWQALLEEGINPLYSEEAEGELATIVVATAVEVDWLQRFAFFEKAAPFSMNIDWDAEWKKHCLDYQDDGYVHVNLANYGSSGEVLLKPGPGFGDLTHPTTCAVLSMMAASVSGRHVIDIGSGSGILSLAAVAMGAKSVVGIEIDKQAILHAIENAELNGMKDKVRFAQPHEALQIPCDDVVVLMNMILSEQRQAWESLPWIHGIASLWLTSGLLEVNRDEYLQMTRRWGWTLVEELNDSGWLGFKFR